jgi:hypothetical protein
VDGIGKLGVRKNGNKNSLQDINKNIGNAEEKRNRIGLCVSCLVRRLRSSLICLTRHFAKNEIHLENTRRAITMLINAYPCPTSSAEARAKKGNYRDLKSPAYTIYILTISA